jgi:hypothetical protein
VWWKSGEMICFYFWNDDYADADADGGLLLVLVVLVVAVGILLTHLVPMLYYKYSISHTLSLLFEATGS